MPSPGAEKQERRGTVKADDEQGFRTPLSSLDGERNSKNAGLSWQIIATGEDKTENGKGRSQPKK